MKIQEVLSPAEMREFIQGSDFRGWLAVATSWAMVAACFALVRYFFSDTLAAEITSPVVLWAARISALAVAVTLIGGRQLAFGILMHDCSHFSLFKTRRLNDFCGQWLVGSPVWQHLYVYRDHHQRHHRWAGSPRDPDLDLVTGYPVTKASLRRKHARDLFGISGIKRLYGNLAMDFGFIAFTVSSRVEPTPRAGWGWLQRLRFAVPLLGPVVLTNVALWAVLSALGVGWLYLVWAVAYLTTFSVFIRIRSIAEHAGTQVAKEADADFESSARLDPKNTTRTTYASPLARVTVAPHRVNYHLEHHLLMTVPYFKLPRLHRVLKERGALQGGYLAADYGEVLRSVLKEPLA